MKESAIIRVSLGVQNKREFAVTEEKKKEKVFTSSNKDFSCNKLMRRFQLLQLQFQLHPTTSFGYQKNRKNTKKIQRSSKEKKRKTTVL